MIRYTLGFLLGALGVLILLLVGKIIVKRASKAA